MIVSAAIQKMIEFYKGNRHDVNHFLKVWAMAKTIGELEGLDRHTQEVLELAAVIHDPNHTIYCHFWHHIRKKSILLPHFPVP